MKLQTWKLIVAGVFLGSALLACNLSNPQPSAQPPPPTLDPYTPPPTQLPPPQGEGDEVATVVAQTVEAEAAVPTNTSEVLLPTATNTQELPTPTATMPPSPTLPPDDPRNSLGAFDWQDTFANGENWTLYNESDFKSEITGGKYVMTKKTVSFGEVWEISWPQARNFYLEATATTGACGGKDRYGLFFRAPDPAKGYLFVLSCDGHFRFTSWDGSEEKVIVNWTQSAAIKAGANQTNRLGVMALDNDYAFYVNGVQVGTGVDSEFTGEGKFGFLIGAEQTENFAVSFDDLTYWGR